MATTFYRDLEPENLPVPNKQVMQLIQHTLRDDAQIDTLTRLISINPLLTAQPLGLVNSAFFGFRQNIKNISDAVIAIGNLPLNAQVVWIKEHCRTQLVP
jgi:HD-like signal output (HDOD) protein